MHCYVYDEYLQDSKYERELAKIELRLTDLGIDGKIARLALFRDPAEFIRDEIKKGVNTIIALGNDVTMRRVIDAAIGHDVVVGIIPIGKKQNEIARMLGIPVGAEACDSISARMVQELDIGKVNEHAFLHRVRIEDARGCAAYCDSSYGIEPTGKGSIEVRNMADQEGDMPVANPFDGTLDLIVQSQSRVWQRNAAHTTTFLPVKELLLVAEKSAILDIDGEMVEGKKFQFSLLPKSLRIIAGKERIFTTHI